MIRLTKLALQRPVTVILCLVTIAYFGFQSLIGARMELIPEMELPMLLISTIYAGAAPDDVEELITTKEEDALATLGSVDTIQSYSMENMSLIMVQYEYGTNMDTAYIDLKKAVDSVKSSLPEDAGEPSIIELDITAMPSITMSVSGSVDENLYTYVENKVVPEFEKLSSVGQVSLSGGQSDYARVQLIEEKLEQYHLTMNQVAQLVGAADFTVPAGSIHVGDQELDVSVANDYPSVESLEDITIPLQNGNVIHLSDIAVVSRVQEDASSIGRYNGEDVITLSITKQQSSTDIDVSRQVMSTIEELKQMNPALHFTVINDSSEMIESSIRDVFSTVILAVVLSMVVLWLFCGDVKAAAIIGISIVCSVVLAMIGMTAMGFSLNVISLTSLVFGVGMMVDNSINVLDGCFRAKEKLDYYHATIEGTRSMIGAIAGGSVTNCIVFVPLLMLEGLTGQMFTQLAWTIIFCLTASLFSAVTIVPLCFYMWHPHENEHAPVNGLLKWMQKWYRNHMPAVVPKTKRVFGITALVLAAALVMATRLGTELLPMSDEGIVNITVNVRPGLTVDAVNEAVQPVEQMVAEDENLDYYLLTYGGSGLSLGSGSAVSISAYLKDDRTLSTDEVIDQWMEQTGEIENCTVSMEPGSSMGSMTTTGRSIELDFQGTDISLSKGSGYSYAQALELIRRAGGEVTEDSVSIPLRKAFVLPYEENFTDTYPLYRDRKDCWMDSEYEFSFKGNGFVIWGNLVCLRHITPDYADRVSTRHIGSEVFALAEPDDPYVAEIEVWIDGRLDHVSVMPMKNTARKLEPAWKYLLPEGGHTVKLVWRNPSDEYLLRINDIMYYSDHQNTDRFYHN